MSIIWHHQWQLHFSLLSLMAAASPSCAVPLPSMLQPRDGSSSDGSGSRGIAPQVWIPAVIVVLFLLGIFALMWSRTTMMSRLRGTSANTNNTDTNTNGATAAREVTATQLANGVTTTRPARGRRNRRTPSQMSVTSLPVYMKEPGDHELVIFRGPEGMEDDAVATRRDEDADEHDSDTSSTLSGRDTPLQRRGSLTTPGGHTDMSAPGLHPSTASLSMMASRDTSALSIDPDAERSTAQLILAAPADANTNTSMNTDSTAPSRNSNRDSAGSADSRSGLMASGGPSDRQEDGDEEDTGDHGGHDDGGAATDAGTTRANMEATERTHEEERLDAFVDRRISMRSIPAEDAPPYFEVVPNEQAPLEDDAQRSNANEDPAVESAASPPGLSPASAPGTRASVDASADTHLSSASAPVEPSTRRRSGILNLLHLNVLRQAPSSAPPVPPVPSSSTSSHNHSPSNGSTISSTQAHSRIFHRASRSNVSTSPSLFRTISGQRSTVSLASTNRPQHRASSSLSNSASQANLTSPSALSVNSISAPFPHTLVRTEIRYPRGGPTPEQIKLISSRESLGRFGVPYGAEAIAHAAATSRLALDELPPPVFENETTEEGMPRASTSTSIGMDSSEDYSHTGGSGSLSLSGRNDIVRGLGFGSGYVRVSSDETEQSAVLVLDAVAGTCAPSFTGAANEDALAASSGFDDHLHPGSQRDLLRDHPSAALGPPLHVAVLALRAEETLRSRSSSPASSTLSYVTAVEQDEPDSPLFYSSENAVGTANARS